LAISPRLRSGSVSFGGGEAEQQLWDVVKGRDENAFYQAETQMLTRENQMLRHRIRELERQLKEAAGTAASVAVTHEPSHASHLIQSTSASEDDPSPSASNPSLSVSRQEAPASAPAPLSSSLERRE